MDNTFVTEIEAMGTELLTYLQSGATFVVEQTPLVLQEILTYYFAYHLIWMLVCLFPLVAWIYAIRRYIKGYAKFSYDEKENWGFCVAFGGVVATVVQIGTLANLFEAVKIALAPRLYLIEYVSQLFTGE